MAERKSKITKKQFIQFLETLPDDADFLVGIGEYESPLADVLLAITGGKLVRFVNQTYLDDCKRIRDEE